MNVGTVCVSALARTVLPLPTRTSEPVVPFVEPDVMLVVAYRPPVAATLNVLAAGGTKALLTPSLNTNVLARLAVAKVPQAKELTPLAVLDVPPGTQAPLAEAVLSCPPPIAALAMAP